MNKQELLNELRVKFDGIKNDLGFKSGFEDIEKIFFIKDFVLDHGFVSDSLSRMICKRIVDTLMNWNEYLHSLVMPNPNNIMNFNESKMFNDEEKKEFMRLMTEVMELVAQNSLAGVSKDKKLEAEFIDKSVNFWNNRFSPNLIKTMKKVYEEWSKK